MKDVVEKANILLSEIRAALARGTRHFDRDGRELTTDREVLEALMRDGEIEFLEPVENES